MTSALVAILIIVLARWIAGPARKVPPVYTTRNVIPLSVWPQSPSQLLREAAQYAHRPSGVEPGKGVQRWEPKVIEIQVSAKPEAPVPAGDPPPIYFKEGEPQTFAEYNAQPKVVADLQDAIARMRIKGLQSIDPQLALGPAGLGKTLLFKVMANEMSIALNRRVPFLEVFPADLGSVDRLDEYVRRAHENPGSVLFIDEIHDLQDAYSRKLYLLLEEHRYQFKGEPYPVKLNPFTLVAATTDMGLLHEALKRRWVEHHLERQSREQLVQLLLKRGFPTAPEAAQEVVKYTHWSGAPWEAVRWWGLAVKHAEAKGAKRLEVRHVRTIIERHNIDELGLIDLDRAVIRALLQPSAEKGRIINKVWTRTHYALSEQDLCTAAGIDKEGYRRYVKPKLLSRNLVTTRGGQALTPMAVERYSWLKGAA